MIISQATLAALRTSLSLAFQTAYTKTESNIEKVATKVPVTTNKGTYGWIAQSIRLREWIGPRKALALSERVYELESLEFEATVKIPRKHILDDNLGMYSSMIMPSMGEATKLHPDTLWEDILINNATCFDGSDFFSDAHPTYAPAGSTQTYDNLYATALTHDNVDALWAVMASYIGEDGHPMKVDARTLIVPPQLKRAAREIAVATNVMKVVDGTSEKAAATIDNVMAGEYEVLVVPGLASVPTRWFLADFSKMIKPFIRQVRSEPIIRSFDSGAERESFDNNEYTWGVDGADGGSYRENVGVTLPFLCAMSEPP
jgi:phage major head subunit gpT-like protein